MPSQNDENRDELDLGRQSFNLDGDGGSILSKPKSAFWGFLSLFKKNDGFQRLGTEDSFEENEYEDDQKEGRWCPEEKAGVLSKLFFVFMDSLMSKGQKKHLDQNDLWDVEHENAAALVGQTFQKNLESTIDPVLAPKGSVLKAIWKTHRKSFLTAGMVKVVNDISSFLGPYILEKLLDHMEIRKEEEENNGGGNRAWLLKGFLIALSLLVANISTTLLINSYFHRLYRISIHLKAQLVQMLYKKSLRITTASRTQLGVGSIVNLQSNDASNMWDLPLYIHILWSGPFQITVIVLMLVRVIGWAPALTGFGTTLLLLPLNMIVGGKMEKFRKQMMTFTDERVKLTTEVIAGIKAIKLYAWEEPYLQKIWKIRELELGRLMRLALVEAIMFAGFDIGPVFVSLSAFGMYALLGKSLKASIAFPALALFTQLEFPLTMFPWQIMSLINGKVALKRVQNFMETDEIEQNNEQGSGGGEPGVTLRNATFSWGSGEDPLLNNLNLDLKTGQLVMVVGEVGAGKSSLLAALLNEMHRVSGACSINGSIAMTAQDAWIQNMSLRENVLMDKEYDEERYSSVVSACALNADLEMLPAGDKTEIGEKGVNLSGGQKHRVALARACYSNADVYLLDDPLSAVDAHVGRHLMDRCICGLLSSKLRILVTHQLQFLPEADLVVVLEGKGVKHIGSYTDLVNKGVKFSELHLEGTKEGRNDTSNNGDDMEQDAVKKEETKKEEFGKKGELTQEEDRAVGQVKRHVYMAYFKSWGPWLILPLLGVMASMCGSALYVSRNWWLSQWAKHAQQHPETPNMSFYATVYSILGGVSIVATFGTNLVIVLGSMNASKKLVFDLLQRTLRLPMSFFDTQPSGRLINRFSKDTQSLDAEIRFVVLMVINCVTHAVFTFLVISFVTKIAIAAALVFAVLYIRIQQKFVAATREMKRLDSVSASPIFSHFSETLQGLQTVRAFAHEDRFLAKNEVLIDNSNRAHWPLVTANQWLSVRLQIMSSIIVFFTAVSTAVVFNTDPGLSGLAITSALGLTGLMDWLVRQISQLEVGMNSVERLVEYEKYDTEKAGRIPGSQPPPSWPSQGAITVDNLWVRYRPELDPVLKGITFSINAKERIGVCGRTGCGKSTLMMSLFRIVEPYKGSIMIDGRDTTAMGLYDLRSNLSLVPQDPVVFSGSIRSNLDPFDDCSSDAQLWEALKQTNLKDHVDTLEGRLDAAVSEGGQNLSVGQRQLLCMARALLRGSRILILDEATSNVDNATDSLIQNTIRSAFKDCTVLTIAHRLRTIVDYDKIMVLDGGTMVEFDSPENLMAKPNSVFSGLMNESVGGSSTM